MGLRPHFSEVSNEKFFGFVFVFFLNLFNFSVFVNMEW